MKHAPMLPTWWEAPTCLIRPNATPESIGVSEGSQRDEALKGQGVPWLMLPGTAGAHIMIPINK